MASVLSRRLGKRSLLGARVSVPSASGDSLAASVQPSGSHAELVGVATQPFPAYKDSHCQEHPKENLMTSGVPGLQQVVFQPGQKVCVWYGGQECMGVVEQHSWAEDKVTVLLLDQKLQICCKSEEVWLPELKCSVPQPAPTVDQGAPAGAYRSVSRNIDVPKEEVRCSGDG